MRLVNISSFPLSFPNIPEWLEGEVREFHDKIAKELLRNPNVAKAPPEQAPEESAPGEQVPQDLFPQEPEQAVVESVSKEGQV